ncbi:hypothetical protein LG634_11480 [Streptomyces bambusae]|uniref:hypothetical protein n=1 Tax=Streptomyces bambusae TaxID=1550616 RepID=UPI001CFE2434|nr:hypothetical protein [Streptomyces bambusae]MCB5165450.1 hypothetical protein [Streptomyces bambusae]
MKDAPEDKNQPPRPQRLYSGGERPFDPEDLVMATGADVTPERLERAKRMIEEKGAAAIEAYLP